MFSVSAINRSEILLSAVVFMAAVWGIVHIPGANLQMIVFTCLLSGLLAGSGTFGDRLKKAFLCACYGAVIQFIFSVSGNLPFLQIILSALLSYFTFLTLNDFHAGCIVLLTGFLSFSAPPGFLPAISRSIDYFAGVIIIMAVTSLAGRGPEEEKLPPPHSKGCSPQQAMTLGAEIAVGTAIAQLLQLPQGTWIVLTILFINMSKPSVSPSPKLAWQRIFAVPLGIFMAGLLLGAFFRIDYRLIWILPFIGATAFFVLYGSGNFFLFSILFMITLTIFADWLMGPDQKFNFRDILFFRSTATLIGALLELFLNTPQDTATERTT